MDYQPDTINITELPDGALDSILSELCSSVVADTVLYVAYGLSDLTGFARWKDVMNFRLVSKSFQRVTDRVVPSFALYQQLFNKGVDPSAWITKQEEELSTRSNGFISKANFTVGGLHCDLLQIPDLSSTPLFALESIINVLIHKLLISNAALISIINIAYAFPNNNTAGFILTLPDSSLFPGKQLAFQVTSLSGYTENDSYKDHREIIVEVADTPLAQVLGVVPNKANLVFNERTYYASGETNGEIFKNLAFFANLSHIMPVYNAFNWIRNLLQVGTAIRQNLPYSIDKEVNIIKEVAKDSMDVDDPEDSMDIVEENSEDENFVHEWNRRTAPTVFSYSLPMYTNQMALLHKMPLLPGVVVNQLMFPSNKSLLQLIMMNKLIQFYRLNKLHKQTILAKLLTEQDNACYQETMVQLFKYITYSHHYALEDPALQSTIKFLISFGTANPEFTGCYLVVKLPHKFHSRECTVEIQAIDREANEKMNLYFGTKRSFSLDYAPGFQIAALQMQKLLAISFVIPPIDIFSLFTILIAQNKEYCMRSYQYQNRKVHPQLAIAFDSSEVDPSCTIEDLQVHEELGESLTSLLISSAYFYTVLQVLHSTDRLQSFVHIRVGYKPELFSTEENETTEFHFKITNALELAFSKQLYDYWINRSMKPHPTNEEIPNYNENYNKYYSTDESYIFMTLPQQENGLAYEIWHAEGLKQKISSIKALLKSNKIAAMDKIKHLETVLPANVKVKCCHAKMIAQLEGPYAAIKYLNSALQENPFNGQLCLTKARILQNANQFKEAIRCYIHICDFPFEHFVQYTENEILLKAYQRLFQLFQQLEMWSGALQICEIFPNSKLLVITEHMHLMKAEKYIREKNQLEYYLQRGFEILARLPSFVKRDMLMVEAFFRLDKNNSNDILKHLNASLDKQPYYDQHSFDIMIHKAVILHQLKHFEEALECYEEMSEMPNRDPTFDIEAAMEAAKKQQTIPWPFKFRTYTADKQHQVWTKEEILMLFIIHPNAVTSAKKNLMKNKTQQDAIQFMLCEIDAAEAQMENQQECYAHIYPADYLFEKFFKNTTLKFIDSIPNVSVHFKSELSKVLDQSGNFDTSERILPFLWQLQPKSKDNMTLLWYPVHPCAIPYLLANGISPDENGAKFYPNINSCAKHYGGSDHSIPLSVSPHAFDRGGYYSMALLVEVDSIAAKQNTVTKATAEKIDWYMLPMVTIHDKAHIGAICYIAIIVESRYWKNKICLTGGKYHFPGHRF